VAIFMSIGILVARHYLGRRKPVLIAAIILVILLAFPAAFFLTWFSAWHKAGFNCLVF
jgi:hypothetical protein